MSEQPFMRPKDEHEAVEAAQREAERLAAEELRKREEAANTKGENPLAGMADKDVDDLFGNIGDRAA